MVNKCSIFGCNSNYRNQPYVKVVSLPTDEVERNRWIDAIPNERSSLLKLKKIYVCEHHFYCEWVSAKGGKRPSQPPSIFPGVQKSCLKQVNSVTRSFTSSAESRAQSEVLNNETQDKITNFSTFCDTVKKRFAKDHLISIDDNGPGFPLEKINNLTEPYVTSRVGGTGLGLAIVKKIIEDHDGKLNLENLTNGGARTSLIFYSERIYFVNKST